MKTKKCQNCWLPTLTDFKVTYCTKCKKLLCVSCQEDGHECKEVESDK